MTVGNVGLVFRVGFWMKQMNKFPKLEEISVPIHWGLPWPKRGESCHSAILIKCCTQIWRLISSLSTSSYFSSCKKKQAVPCYAFTTYKLSKFQRYFKRLKGTERARCWSKLDQISWIVSLKIQNLMESVLKPAIMCVEYTQITFNFVRSYFLTEPSVKSLSACRII